jgi:hypothetical protein
LIALIEVIEVTTVGGFVAVTAEMLTPVSTSPTKSAAPAAPPVMVRTPVVAMEPVNDFAVLVIGPEAEDPVP